MLRSDRRISDEARAKEFQGGFPGFQVDWEALISEGSPIYLQVSHGACVLNLSEHYGDATPGSAMRIGMEDAVLDAYQEGLLASAYQFARLGKPQLQTWGLRELLLTAPFGNRLVFFSVP